MVKTIFPVTLPPKGKNGIRPSRLLIQIKKKTERRKGIYFPYFFSPIFGIAMSSRTKRINGSKNPDNPLGAFSFFLYCFAAKLKIKNIRIAARIIEKTVLVIEKSKGRSSYIKE